MTNSIDSVFRAGSKSVFSFLSEQKQGLYIPSYQRQYRWDEENVDRLFEDAIHGLNLLMEGVRSYGFLGTIITMSDSERKTVDPLYRNQTPEVLCIIDGQQRLCTLMMLNIAIHNHYTQLLKKIKKKDRELDHYKWLIEQIEQSSGYLEETFILENKSGEDNFKFYPRIIRAINDAWSWHKAHGKYLSPIACLIWNYINHIKNEDETIFYFKPDLTQIHENLDRYKTLLKIYPYINKRLKDVLKIKGNLDNFPSNQDIIKDDELQKLIFNDKLPPEVKHHLINNQDDENFQLMIRVLLLSDYINEKFALTIVTTSNEEDAFEMFEALNATGEPLTAYETFVPQVIAEEGLEEYQLSESHKYLKIVENYLSRFTKASENGKATSELLISFRLTEDGGKLTKKLNSQRVFLKQSFSNLESLQEKRFFINRLSNNALYFDKIWNSDIPHKLDYFDVSCQTTEVCLLALNKINHTVTIPPLVRFFSVANDADEAYKDQYIKNYLSAVKATAAFSMIWRASFEGTKGIDNVYRKIMRDGIEDKDLLPMAEKSEGSIVSIDNYKTYLKYNLETNPNKTDISKKELWVNSCLENNIYENHQVLSKFLLLAASNDSIEDIDNPGLIKKGQKNSLNVFSVNNWNHNYNSVEHIAPQNNDSSWNDSIYTKNNIVGMIGNLTLLPVIENVIVSNKPWETKKIYYQLFSADDPNKFSKLIEQYNQKNKDQKISEHSQDIIKQIGVIKLCSSVAKFESEWDADIIYSRSKRIYELAWDNIYQWLE